MKTNRDAAASDGYEKNQEIDVMTTFFMDAVNTYLSDETKAMSRAICDKLEADYSEKSYLYALVSGFLIGMEECTKIHENLS